MSSCSLAAQCLFLAARQGKNSCKNFVRLSRMPVADGGWILTGRLADF
jgi:hypothetical protein